MTHAPRLIAHRGLSAQAPENTLAAVRAAHDAGIDWVELDVQLLGDGTPVIWHDHDVRRCSDGRGRLGDLTLAEAKRLDAGGWFGEAFAGEPMASLVQMLELLDELDMGLNLELKVNRGRDPKALVEGVLPVLLEAQPVARLIVSSFDARALDHARRHARPDCLPLGLLLERVPRDWASRCEAIDAYTVHTDWRRLRAARAGEITRAGYPLLCYTANDPLAFASRWQWGVSGVISDDPTRFEAHA
ncbi:glycerophosphoryl diester phosphodiesterase [Halomonas halmophila]|uniref:Glycerophosphoryl diester phosphodiesterase n=1 Tax=Halomonas halmophila TaxID=252 RepID=A0A4Y4EY22_9GAMM|nr:glycerophosphoryl diester phosphodiesterase [Halomonas halmophila]GED22087.1 glycerophosphoryl diester phosphodiesterase [Halomonas halmophila]